MVFESQLPACAQLTCSNALHSLQLAQAVIVDAHVLLHSWHTIVLATCIWLSIIRVFDKNNVQCLLIL